MSALRPAEQSSQLVLILRSTVAITPFVYRYIFYNENNIATCEIDAENDNLWCQKRPSFQPINLDDEPPLDRPLPYTYALVPTHAVVGAQHRDRQFDHNTHSTS